MKIPKKIKIGSKTHKVKMVKRLVGDDKVTRLRGQIDHEGQTIKIDPLRNPEGIRVTILHEILHGCSEFAKINHEEDDVYRLSETLSMVFYDNPKLLDLWRRKDGRKSGKEKK